ncbi:MAG: hypothetical protein FWH43_01945 [Endomicrobia bacterium]|nr:hypothetical protein [Endomicrobiia bacterium]
MPFKKPMAAKVAFAVVFAIFMNMANIPLLLGEKYSLNCDGTVLQIGDRLGKIYNVVNVPVQMVNDLFNKNMNMMSDNKEENAAKTEKPVFCVLSASSNNAKKSSGTLFLDAVPQSGGVINKDIAKNNLLPSVMNLHYGRCGPGNNAIWYLLLFLILMPILPRGIPVRVRKFIINMNFAYSRLYLK